MGQDISSIPSISLGDYTLEMVKDFTYLGSAISSNLSLDAELNTWIGKAVAAMAHLAKRVWENSTLTTNTKMKVYQACVLSTQLYGMRHGLCTATKNANSIPSTCTTSDGLWASPGRTVSQTRMSWLGQEYQACLPCLPRGACTGLVTSAAYRMDELPRTCCMVSLPLAPDLQEGLFFTSTTSVNEI